jgi:glycosyltransferase involved in cell wall biosynthesis
LLEEYKAGFNCNNGDTKDIAAKIELLYREGELRQKMGENNKRLAEEKFDRNKTYPQIIKLINSLLK